MFSMFLIEICVILLLFKYVSVGNMSKRVQQHLNKKKKSVFLATRPKRSPKMTRQSQNQNDTCRWNLYPDGLFSVSVTYNHLVTFMPLKFRIFRIQILFLVNFGTVLPRWKYLFFLCDYFWINCQLMNNLTREDFPFWMSSNHVHSAEQVWRLLNIYFGNATTIL